jgi:hypothetical protein
LKKPEDYGIKIVTSSHVSFKFYEFPKDIDEWNECPFCHLKPKIWVFDNGRYATCGCRLKDYSDYDAFHIKAESIMDYIKRNGGSTAGYDFDGLKRNWNNFCDSVNESVGTAGGEE